jgi:hypothetical protein
MIRIEGSAAGCDTPVLAAKPVVRLPFDRYLLRLERFAAILLLELRG